jgi:hypothetical protein
MRVRNTSSYLIKIQILKKKGRKGNERGSREEGKREKGKNGER